MRNIGWGKCFRFPQHQQNAAYSARVWCCTVYCDSSRVPPVSPSHLIVGIHTANQYNWLLTIHWAPLACLHVRKKYSKISFVCILGKFYSRKIYLLNRSARVGQELVIWPHMQHCLAWSLANIARIQRTEAPVLVRWPHTRPGPDWSPVTGELQLTWWRYKWRCTCLTTGAGSWRLGKYFLVLVGSL